MMSAGQLLSYVLTLRNSSHHIRVSSVFVKIINLTWITVFKVSMRQKINLQHLNENTCWSWTVSVSTKWNICFIFYSTSRLWNFLFSSTTSQNLTLNILSLIITFNYVLFRDSERILTNVFLQVCFQVTAAQTLQRSKYQSNQTRGESTIWRSRNRKQENTRKRVKKLHTSASLFTNNSKQIKSNWSICL